MLPHLSLRTQIGILLIGVSAFCFLFVFINRTYYKGEMELAKYHQDISTLKALTYRSIYLQDEFMFSEARTNEFHINGTSKNILSFEESIAEIRAKIGEIQQHPFTADFDLSKKVMILRDRIAHHATLMQSLKEKTLQMGFYNFGLEGELRLYIHQLEDHYQDIIPLSKILQLRRSEKDFMLRHNFDYYHQNQALRLEIQEMLSKPTTGKEQMANLLLDSYGKTFERYATLDTVIGFNHQGGIRNEIRDNANQLILNLDDLALHSDLKSQAYVNQIYLLFTVALILFSILLTLIIYHISKKISLPIHELSAHIATFIQSNYKTKVVLSEKNRKDEIGQLARSINTLQTEITGRFTTFRTEAEKKQKKLERQKEQIELQELLMRESRNSLKEQIQYYSDGIHYANRIQQSIFPKLDKVRSVFGQVGLHYNPKDIVSGDFYWVYENDNYRFMAIADCTGHGVPGAFMSILGISYLNYGVRDKQIMEPSHLLNYLNSKVAEVLGQYGENSEVKDGMDISLIRIDKTSSELTYSGAQQELLIIRGDEFISLAPDRFPIGWILPGAKKQFSQQSHILQKNDLVVLYTDGTVDQFGGPKNKKYKRKKLYELLHSSHHLSPDEISKLIGNSLKNWQGKNEQTDDICCILFRHQYSIEHSLRQSIHNSSFFMPSMADNRKFEGMHFTPFNAVHQDTHHILHPHFIG